MRLPQLLSVLLMFFADINGTGFVDSTDAPIRISLEHWHKCEKGTPCTFKTDEKPKGAIVHIHAKVTGGVGKIYAGAHRQVFKKYMATEKLATEIKDELEQPIIIQMPYESEVFIGVKPDTTETIFSIRCDDATGGAGKIVCIPVL